jgi:hypothetical protein
MTAIMRAMNKKHHATLTAIFAKPTRSGIAFSDIEKLVLHLGGDVREGEGSRVVLDLNGSRKFAHRPHPGKEAKKYQVEDVREWLASLGVTP